MISNDFNPDMSPFEEEPDGIHTGYCLVVSPEVKSQYRGLPGLRSAMVERRHRYLQRVRDGDAETFNFENPIEVKITVFRSRTLFRYS